MAKINAVWHPAHPMPTNPDPQSAGRLALAHYMARGRRKIVIAELKRRGINFPAGPA